VHLGAVDDAVLGFVVDLDLRMIRADVALAAGIGRAGLRLAEAVASMTGGAGAEAAVRVDPPDAGVGPGARLRPADVFASPFLGGDELELRPVALLAAGVDRVDRP
jgi:hypothetical protein